MSVACENLKSVAGIPAEDAHLFAYVSVKDLARFYEELERLQDAKSAWEALKPKLLAREHKQLLQEQHNEEDEPQGDDAPEQDDIAVHDPTCDPEEEPDVGEDGAEPELAPEDQAEIERLEAERLAAKKHRRWLREQARLPAEAAEAEAEAKEASKKQKRRSRYVTSNPLEAALDNGHVEDVEQVHVAHTIKPPPAYTEELLARTYTPKCPNCQAKFAKPPPEWNCTICLRRGKTFKCWQPDGEASKCGSCSTGVGRFSRHHCRNCGRVVCGKCSEKKAMIPSIGFASTPVKTCTQCITDFASGSGAPAERGVQESSFAQTVSQPTIVAENAK